MSYQTGDDIKVRVRRAGRLSGTVAPWRTVGVRHHSEVALIQVSDRRVPFFVCSVYMARTVLWEVSVTRELEVVLASWQLDYGICELVVSACCTMCSLGTNNSMLFLLLRTTLLIIATCVATMCGAPVQSDTQAMVSNFGNKSYFTCRIWDFQRDENSYCGILKTPRKVNTIWRRCWYSMHPQALNRYINY